jgi:hypothetical protein
MTRVHVIAIDTTPELMLSRIGVATVSLMRSWAVAHKMRGQKSDVSL